MKDYKTTLLAEALSWQPAGQTSAIAEIYANVGYFPENVPHPAKRANILPIHIYSQSVCTLKQSIPHKTRQHITPYNKMLIRQYMMSPP
jgi:hypothetical protein